MFDASVPNLLTVFRMLLVPVLIAAMLSSWEYGDLLALVIFTVASATDALDGWIALCLLVFEGCRRRVFPWPVLAATVSPLGPLGSTAAIEYVARG